MKHPSCFHIIFLVTLAWRWLSHFRKDETKTESKVPAEPGWEAASVSVSFDHTTVSFPGDSLGHCHGRRGRDLSPAHDEPAQLVNHYRVPLRLLIQMVP